MTENPSVVPDHLANELIRALSNSGCNSGNLKENGVLGPQALTGLAQFIDKADANELSRDQLVAVTLVLEDLCPPEMFGGIAKELGTYGPNIKRAVEWVILTLTAVKEKINVDSNTANAIIAALMATGCNSGNLVADGILGPQARIGLMDFVDKVARKEITGDRIDQVIIPMEDMFPPSVRANVQREEGDMGHYTAGAVEWFIARC
jgi:hypothetical protein